MPQTTRCRAPHDSRYARQARHVRFPPASRLSSARFPRPQRAAHLDPLDLITRVMHFSTITIESTTKTSYISHSFHCTAFWTKRKAGECTSFDFLPSFGRLCTIYIKDSVVQTLIIPPSPEVLPHQGRLIVPKVRAPPPSSTANARCIVQAGNLWM